MFICKSNNSCYFSIKILIIRTLNYIKMLKYKSYNISKRDLTKYNKLYIRLCNIRNSEFDVILRISYHFCENTESEVRKVRLLYIKFAFQIKL